MICIKGLQCVQQGHIQNIFSTSKTKKKIPWVKSGGCFISGDWGLCARHPGIDNHSPVDNKWSSIPPRPGFLCSEVRGDERSTCASNDTGNDEKCHEKSTNAVTSSKLTNNFMASSLCLKLSLRIFYFLVFHWNPLNLKGIPKAIAQPSKLSSQGNNLLKVALSPNVTSFPDLLWQKNVLSCFFSSNKWCKW